MANEKGTNKRKREQKKINMLKLLFNIDLCACGGGHRLRCRGICRKVHTNSSTKMVECGECYQVSLEQNERRPKRTWKYGHQKERNERLEKQQRRREKFEKDVYKSPVD